LVVYARRKKRITTHREIELMPIAVASPIAGVTPNRETLIEEVWPSIAATGPGRLIGQICNSIPVKINGVRISQILFALPLGAIGAPMYLLTKITGQRYSLTNRTVQVRSSIGDRLYKQIKLEDIADIAVVVLPGQEFHNAADLEIKNERGDVIMKLPGVVRPQRFRQVILDAREARVRNDASLATINARVR
jgi:hypothetical protein